MSPFKMREGKIRFTDCLLPPRPGEVEDTPYSEEDVTIVETAQVQIGLR